MSVTELHRRNMLKLAGALGLSLALPGAPLHQARVGAQDDAWAG